MLIFFGLLNHLLWNLLRNLLRYLLWYLLRYVVFFLGILLIDEARRKSLPRLGLHRNVLHRLLSYLTWEARCWHGSVNHRLRGDGHLRRIARIDWREIWWLLRWVDQHGSGWSHWLSEVRRLLHRIHGHLQAWRRRLTLSHVRRDRLSLSPRRLWLYASRLLWLISMHRCLQRRHLTLDNRILSLPKLLLRVRKLLLRYRLILWRHFLAVVRLLLRVLFLLLLIVGWLHIFESFVFAIITIN